MDMGTAKKVSLRGILEGIEATLREAGVAATSTNFYLHDPDWPQSIHIGKRWNMGPVNGANTPIGWLTHNSEFWNNTQELIAYLNAAEKKDLKSAAAYDDHVIFCWVADEYGDTYLPSTVADMITGYEDTGYSDEDFS